MPKSGEGGRELNKVVFSSWITCACFLPLGQGQQCAGGVESGPAWGLHGQQDVSTAASENTSGSGSGMSGNRAVYNEARKLYTF